MRLQILSFLGIAVVAPLAAATLWAASPEPPPDLAAIENRWVEIRYDMKGVRERMAAARALEAQSRTIMNAHSSDSAARVWYALVLLLEPEIQQNMASLGVVRQAKELLEEAERADPHVLDGRVFTTLGSLYSEVPGWPIAFGNNKKAVAYFQKALEIDPQSLEANYLYADYLVRHGHRQAAADYYQRALAAPIRPEHERMDQNRRKEVEEDYAALRSRLKS